MRRVSVLIVLAFWFAAAVAESAVSLRFNPFDKPEVEAIKPVTDSLVSEPAKLPELTATLVSDKSPMVIFDGELLKLGQEREGYVLKAVGESAAVFEHKGELVGIKVADPEADKGLRR